MSMEQNNGEPAGLAVRRRLGTAPSEREACSYGGDCPDVFELANGDFAIIGQDVSLELDLPADAGRSEAERTVVLPRNVLLAALRDLSGSI
jgi:hypothetical protein